MRPTVVPDGWPTPRHGEPWTHEEDCYLSERVAYEPYAEIARALGRTTSAVIHRAAETHNTPMQAGLLTTADLADLLGCSVQYVARLARQGRIPAHRVPGGRTWLYPLEAAGVEPVDAATIAERVRAFRRQVARARTERHWEPEVDWAA